MSSHDEAPKSTRPARSLGLGLFALSYAVTNSLLLARSVKLFGWLLLLSSRPRDDPTRMNDLYILAVSLLWSIRHELWTILSQPLVIRLIIAKSTTFALLFLGMLFYRWRNRAIAHGWATAILKQDALSSPWIIPSKTTHTRLFPKKHSFAYSYLTVAIPVGFKGWVWPLISVDVSYARGWFHVQARDHLERGNPELDMKDKLAKYLRSQNVRDEDWAYAYLVTAPRFLGYSFNPVSFWYIYDEKRVLKKMILEVNNTFDERRMYLLDAQSPLSGEEDTGKFKQTWPKDFHVSPFNSRKGSYSLTAADPFSRDGGLIRPIDNTIVMSSSKGHGKIVARLMSEGEPINPRTLTRPQTLAFLARWWWVGFFTFPRIVYEAGRLFFKRKLHVWFRPEVLDTSVGRNYTAMETTFQTYVAAYIETVVSQSRIPVCVTLDQPDGSSSRMKSNAEVVDKVEAPANCTRLLRIRVLTPAFYSRFVHYMHTREALDREALFTDEKNRTLWSDNPSLLAEIFANADGDCGVVGELSTVTRLRWAVHKWLRCPPGAQAYQGPAGKPASDCGMEVKDIRVRGPSPLDRFVFGREDSWLYLRCCARLFLAERFALGLVPVIELIDACFRVALCYTLTIPAVLRPMLIDYSTGPPPRADMKIPLMIVGEVLGLWALHLWSQVKGLPDRQIR